MRQMMSSAGSPVMSELAEVIPLRNATPPAPAVKDLYEVGEIPPLGHVPKSMHAWAIRREPHGAPESAMHVETLPAPDIGPAHVLVMVAAAGCTGPSRANAYRMLFGHGPPVLAPGHNVLVWGAAGGLGSMAIQLIATAGAHPVAVISEDDKRDFVMSLGAKGVINRKKFNCWGRLPDVNDSGGYGDYMKKCREFGKAIWDITGKGNDVDFVFEHPGEQTFPVSCFVVKRGGMVVFCAGTTGYNITFDARFVWMRQKRIQGSHFANLLQASQASELVIERRIDPCMSEG